MLTFTWCHRCPGDTPTNPPRPWTSNGITHGTENKVNDVAFAFDGWQGGAILLAPHSKCRGHFYDDAILPGAATLPHQSCPVTIHDCQMVRATHFIAAVTNLECSKLQ